MQLWQPQATQLWQLESSFAVLGSSLKHLLQLVEHIMLTILRDRPLRRRRVLNRPLSSRLPASARIAKHERLALTGFIIEDALRKM